MTKNNFREERVYLSGRIQSIIHRSHGRSSRQILGGTKTDHEGKLLTALLPSSHSSAVLTQARYTFLGIVPPTLDCPPGSELPETVTAYASSR